MNLPVECGRWRIGGDDILIFISLKTLSWDLPDTKVELYLLGL